MFIRGAAISGANCFLFGPEEGCRKHGYAAHMADILRKPRTIFVPGKAPRTLGGHRFTDEVVARSIRRLRNWMVLAVHVVRAEFPGFEALAGFDMFALHRSDKSAHEMDGLKKSIELVAKLCQCSQRSLTHEFDDVAPIARQFFKTTQCTTLEAWRHAVKATSRSRSGNQSRKTSN